MALITCVRCGKGYSDTLNGCPHCKYVPALFVCQECGAVYGKTDAACSNCGITLDHTHDIPAGEILLNQELEKVTAQFHAAKTVEELSEISGKLQQIGQFFDINDLIAECGQKQTYITALQIMENGNSIAELANAANMLESLGNYQDASGKLQECCGALNQARYAQAEANLSAAHDVASWQAARVMFAGLGDYNDAAAKAAYCDQQIAALQSAAKKKKTVAGAIVGAVAAVAAIAILLFAYIIPNGNYSKGASLYAKEEYAAAAEAFTAAGNFKDAVAQAEEAQFMAQVKDAYLAGVAALEAGDFAAATDNFLAAGDYKDAVAKLGEVAYTLGEQLVAAGDYYGAAIAYINAGAHGEIGRAHV